MESFIFAVYAISPIIITVVIGYVLKKIGLVNYDIAKILNKMVFRVFLPAMLFLNVYKIEDLAKMDFSYIIYAVIVTLAVFIISVPIVMHVTKKQERRGVILQSVFRSNYALIGIPLAESLFGEAGLAVASLMSAVIIPIYNVLAVICLSVFGTGSKKPSVKKILLNIVKNPLIQSVMLGVVCLLIRSLFVRFDISFRLSDIKPIYTVLGNLSGVATPLALIALGAQFEFSAVSALKREIIFGTMMRIFIVPLIGIGLAYLFFSSSFGGAHFAAFIAVFATPVAVSSVPMAQEMNSDVTLAGQLVVWTTLISAFTVFITTWLLKMAEIF